MILENFDVQLAKLAAENAALTAAIVELRAENEWRRRESLAIAAEPKSSLTKTISVISIRNCNFDRLYAAPIGDISSSDADAFRKEVGRCVLKHRLHSLVGSHKKCVAAGAYRLLFFRRVDSLTLLFNSSIYADNKRGLEAARRIRAARWWVRNGARSPREILIEAERWAVERIAGETQKNARESGQGTFGSITELPSQHHSKD